MTTDSALNLQSYTQVLADLAILDHWAPQVLSSENPEVQDLLNLLECRERLALQENDPAMKLRLIKADSLVREDYYTLLQVDGKWYIPNTSPYGVHGFVITPYLGGWAEDLGCTRGQVLRAFDEMTSEMEPPLVGAYFMEGGEYREKLSEEVLVELRMFLD